MEDDRILIVAEESFTFGNRGDIRGADGNFAVMGAPEKAFHTYPLGDNDFFWFNPFVIRKTMLSKQFIEFLTVNLRQARSCLHSSPPFYAPCHH
jgi:hypothetical protein